MVPIGDDCLIVEEYREKAKALLETNRWYLFIIELSLLSQNIIALQLRPTKGGYASADKVLEAMNLDLKDLADIFTRMPEANNYHNLGRCRLTDEKQWQCLADLTGKVICIVKYKGTTIRGEPTGTLVTRYFPNKGKCDKSKGA